MAKTIREFPGVVSITITNKCNLRCNMCAQWSREGYIRNGQCDFSHSGKMAPYECLTRSIDEISKYGAMLILRGGEPLLYPKIIDIIRYAKNKKVTVSLETNAVLLKQFAKDLVGLRLDDLRISVDGPEKVHDSVRGVKGTFSRMRNSLGVLLQEEEKQGFEISRSMACTISDLNYQTIGQMPEVARALGFDGVTLFL